MKQFEKGGKVKVVKATLNTYWYAEKVGQVFTLAKQLANGDWLTAEHSDCTLSKDDIELVQDEKESTSVWLKENKWFIRTGSPEKSVQTQKWLFEHGIGWADSPKDSFNIYGTQHKALTNTYGGPATDTIMWSVDNDWIASIAQEITLEFETILKSVKLPEAPKPTEQELRIIELEKTIAQASAQIKQLKEEI